MILANKKIGETPLELINRLKSRGLIKAKKTTYAGRLDPMAEGLMILLNDDEIQEKEKYMQLNKTYEAKFLFGIITDSYDPLGTIISTNFNKLDHGQLKKVILNLHGTHNLPYPPYSSKTVQGKPLWQWAKEGNLDKITIPKRKMTVKEITLNSLSEESIGNITKSTITNIKKVEGDFRQNTIINNWLLLQNKREILPIASVTITCSAGTYIRSLAHLAGQQLKTGAIALHIKRTRIGKHSLSHLK